MLGIMDFGFLFQRYEVVTERGARRRARRDSAGLRERRRAGAGQRVSRPPAA